MKGRVLTIAGSDSGGGAGIQADIKTITMLGGYAASALTAITVQDTRGVKAILPVPANIIGDQITVVLNDIGADCIKTGMLGDAQIIDAIAETLKDCAGGIPLVIDPVMVAKGGAKLLPDEAIKSLKNTLLPLGLVITPNVPELCALSGQSIDTVQEMEAAARLLSQKHNIAVLAKGGHLGGDKLIDILIQPDGTTQTFSAKRIATAHTHGTGCTLASALACGIAQGLSLEDAAARAHAYVQAAIASAPGLGKGHGPLDHGHPLKDRS